MSEWQTRVLAAITSGARTPLEIARVSGVHYGPGYGVPFVLRELKAMGLVGWTLDGGWHVRQPGLWGEL